MAATYTAVATGVTWATTAKVFYTLWNGAGSGKIIKVRRVWLLNAQASAATGIVQNYGFFSIVTAASGGSPTTITPVKHDTNSAAVPAQIVSTSGNTSNGAGYKLFERKFSGDEAAVNTFSLDEIETLPVLNCIWDSGYGNSSTQPLTLREGQGMSIYNSGVPSSAGNIDICVEFTLE